ncbi:MAG: cryptochrome/photolyase family protein [Synechococcales cyanobacterium RU_4_20]|nr:cryptochrome/photolyase family protein [Synechococcales cyanobacterium RU_4_20]
MGIGIWVLGDQLGLGQAALMTANQDRANPDGANPDQASETGAKPPQPSVLLLESRQHVTQPRIYHYQKLVLIWSAMRHFAAELRAAGWSVTYGRVENFETGLRDWLKAENITELRVMIPSDRPFQRFLEQLDLPCTLVWVANNHFLWSQADFDAWAQGYKQLRMENFYREGRKRFNILLEDSIAGPVPEGGQWNFDKDNRKPPKTGLQPPPPLQFEPDAVTRQVIADIQAEEIPGFGAIEPFGWAVTRGQALQVLENFIQVRLKTFGPYQDAMVVGEDTLWHALLSPYLNLGLLQPSEVIEAVEVAYQRSLNTADALDLASVEGFIRQVLGWREYMQGLYRYLDAEAGESKNSEHSGHYSSHARQAQPYGDRNWFNHTQPLPAFFWTGQTEMNCLKQTLDQTLRTGYAHHIQRLMVLANFALIAGLNPQETENWFHSAFIDAYDWVMQTNVIGMGLFADGGKLSSKPYAASANYIHKMSNYCQSCTYNFKAKTGDRACPFNYFYWDFLARHRDKLKRQGRMNLILGQLDRMEPTVLEEMRSQAAHWHQVHNPAVNPSVIR